MEINLPRQLPDLRRLRAIISRGEIPQVPKIMHDTVRERRTERPKFILGQHGFAPRNELGVVGGRWILSVEFCIEFRVGFLSLWR